MWEGAVARTSASSLCLASCLVCALALAFRGKYAMNHEQYSLDSVSQAFRQANGSLNSKNVCPELLISNNFICRFVPNRKHQILDRPLHITLALPMNTAVNC